MTANDHHPVPGSPSALTETRATTDGRPRCARAARCEDAQPITTDDGTSCTAGALVHDGSHLCPVCTRYLGYALTGLPLDVAELSLHMAPTLQITYRDPDVPAAPRVKKHAPLPINGRAEALQALIDHETGVWAQAVADAAGVPWSQRWARHSRRGNRVQKACQLLQYRVQELLALPVQWHETRSAGEHPLDGWDADWLAAMDYWDGRWWVPRTGLDAALALFELHAATERLTGRADADRCRIPCPKCERRALVRERTRGRVVCRCCWRQMSDDDYEQLLAALELI